MTTQPRLHTTGPRVPAPHRRQRRLLVAMLVVTLIWVALTGLLLGAQRLLASSKPPEAGQALIVQATLPFQVLIPGYLPPEFDRARAAVKTSQTEPGSGPALQIGYHNRRTGAAVFVREWMPISPTLETLIGSRAIETKWGRGYLLAERESGYSIVWADIGGLRVSVESPTSEPVSPEVALAIMNSMGPAANQRVSSTIAEKPAIREASPVPPVAASLNDQGVQELTLVATAAGYSPAHFSVARGVPVRLIFRQLGDAACAGELVFPADPARPTILTLGSAQDVKTLEFTPVASGDFTFKCVHDIYHGVMSVHD